MNREEEDAAALGTLRKLVFFITREATELEAFGVGNTIFTIAVNHVEHPIVARTKHADIQQLLADIEFFLHAAHHQHALAVNRENIAERGAFFHGLALAHSVAGKAFFIYVQRLILNSGLCTGHGIKGADFRLTRPCITILLAQVLKPADGVTGQLCQILAGLLNLCFQGSNVLEGVMNLILGNLLDADFRQAHNIITRHGAPEVYHEGL